MKKHGRWASVALILVLLAGCGAGESTPTPTPTSTPMPTPAVVEPETAALEQGAAEFLEDQASGRTYEMKSMTKVELSQPISAAISVVDVYALEYKIDEDGMWTTGYLLFDATPGFPPGYLGCWAHGERVEAVGVEVAATEALYRLWDLEYSFPRVNDQGYFGLGSQDAIGYADWLDKGETETLEDFDVWQEGDYWYETEYDGLALLAYYNAGEGRSLLGEIETTRDDLTTYRGARVGMNKEEILTLYPEIDPEAPWDGEWGNHLAYPSDPDTLAGLYIHFFFDEADVLTKIEMENYFD